MSQYGNNAFGGGPPGSGNGRPQPQFHVHQRQRPTAHHAMQNTQAFNYNAPANAPAGQFRSQPSASVPRPFPQQPHQQHQQSFHQPVGAPAPHQFQQSQQFQPQPQQQQQPQAFFPTHDYQQPASQPPAPQPTSFGYSSGNTSSFQQPKPVSSPHQPAQSQPQDDFINQLSSNPMAGLAMNTAQDFLSKQSAIYLPGAFSFLGSVKYYFTVNNSYVKSRLKILLMPFWHRNWRRLGTESSEGKPSQYAPPSRDNNAPDLYLPLMSFLTYILIVGYTKGASNQFSPDVIVNDASYCFVMQLVEIAIFAACLYLLSSPISFLDLVSFSGYKYIPLVINTIVYQMFGTIAYYVALLYTGIALSYFTLNCMKGSVAEPTAETRAFRNYILFGVSCLQLVLVSWISYTTSPHE